MAGRDLSNAIEIIPKRLYWTATSAPPGSTLQSHFFSIDQELVYEPFYADFGPLNLGMTFRYCKMLEAKLKDPALSGKNIVHYCSQDPKKRANAAYLICAYQVLVMNKSADMAWQPFIGIYPPFLPFRDATCSASSFHLTILDCLKGLEHAMELNWLNYTTFNVELYEFFEKVENGDMSWIIPGKFLAFVGPAASTNDGNGFPMFTPEDYVPHFRSGGIGLVVRLNRKQYDRKRFIEHGIRHVDLYFPDGSCPPKEIIDKFLHITENERGAIGVHCKAGLGRTGTLIGLYAMKNYRFPSRAFIGWNRICRPGSILGPQQQYLCDMERDMFQMGAGYRIPPAITVPSRPKLADEHQLEQQFQRMSLQARAKEDYGQGERLVDARRRHHEAIARRGPIYPLAVSA